MNNKTIDNNNNFKQSPFAGITPEWAWGGSSGEGVSVAVIDSGIDGSHPALKDCDIEYYEVTGKVDSGESTEVAPCGPGDVFGHGTACAGIIHSISPDSKIISIKTLGRALKGRGEAFITALRWVVDNGIHAANLSLGTTKPGFFAPLHELMDKAYFARLIMVCAKNNSPAPSFPSEFSSIFGVKAIYTKDPYEFRIEDSPPVEFSASGVDVKAPWLNGGYEKCTGNSFAAPHITGITARILAKHPYLTPFMLKSVLYSIALGKME